MTMLPSDPNNAPQKNDDQPTSTEPSGPSDNPSGTASATTNNKYQYSDVDSAEFSKKLGLINNKLHATGDVDKIIPELGEDICSLFNSERLTIYVVGVDNTSLISIVQTGLNSFKNLKLPISEKSIAGYSAMHRKLFNIKDAYDIQELARYSPHLRFLQEVDKRTGYHTRHMLVAPIVDSTSNGLLGIVQILNNKAGVPFSLLMESGAKELAQALADALALRQQAQSLNIYDCLVADGAISAAELELAKRTAKRRKVAIEEVLMDEFQVSTESLGKALSACFKVPYEPFKPDRIVPAKLLRNLRYGYVKFSHWIPINETQEGIVILTTDPERIQASREVNSFFPKHHLNYRVCTQHEFTLTLNLLYKIEAATYKKYEYLVTDGVLIEKELMDAVRTRKIELDEDVGIYGEPPARDIVAILKEDFHVTGDEFARVLKPVDIDPRYAPLVSEGVLTATDLERATRLAKRRLGSTSSVLTDVYNVSTAAVGEAFSRYFNVPYEPDRADRPKPTRLLRYFRKEELLTESEKLPEGALYWLPLEETPEGVVILTTDPTQVRESQLASNAFPEHQLIYRVCTPREFRSTMRLFFYLDQTGTGNQYDYLEHDFVLSNSELQQALTTARHKKLEVEEVLRNEFMVTADEFARIEPIAPGRKFAYLVSDNVLTEDTLRQASRKAKREGVDIESVLAAQNKVTPAQFDRLEPCARYAYLVDDGVLTRQEYDVAMRYARAKFMGTEEVLRLKFQATPSDFDRIKEPVEIDPRYASMVTDGVLTAATLECAARLAKRKDRHIEAVLRDDFQVSTSTLGNALSRFFGVPYEAYREDMPKPADIFGFKGESTSSWVPIADSQENLVILTTEPTQVRDSRVVNDTFPNHQPTYRVCTRLEYAQIQHHFYGIVNNINEERTNNHMENMMRHELASRLRWAISRLDIDTAREELANVIHPDDIAKYRSEPGSIFLAIEAAQTLPEDMHEAGMENARQIVRLLIHAGADVNRGYEKVEGLWM